MWLFLMNMFSQPGRTLRTWIAAIVVGVILVLALLHAGAQTQAMLVGILGALLLLMAIRVPMRRIITLMAVAVVIIGVLSLISEAGGYVPLIMIVLGLTFGLSTWLRAGAPGSLGEIARYVLRGPPRSRGAHWATLRELRAAGFLGDHGCPIGVIDRHVVRLPVERERESVIVTAATGSGKTSGVGLPVLIEMASRPPEQRYSKVIVDPKDELTRISLPTLATTHRVLVLDPSNPDIPERVGFDPLATMPDPSDDGFVGEVKQLAQSWFWATRGGVQTQDPFWINQPRSILETLFLAFLVTQPGGTFVELADWIRSMKIDELQHVLDSTGHPAVRAGAEMLHSLGLSEKTIGPIWSDVLQRFDILDDPRVRRSMAGQPVNWESFIRDPTALFLRVGAQDAERLAPLITMCLGQIYRELIKAASRYPDNRLPREVRILIDELGNLPRIYGLETALATLRSYGVGHVAFIQSSTQLSHRYGRDLATTIQANMVTKIIMGGADEADAKAFSQRCGEVTEFHASRSWSGRGSFRRGSENYSHAPERHPLIAPSEIIHMKDELLVSTRGIAPLRLAMRPYYTDPETVAQLEADRLAYEQRQREDI